MYVSKFLSKKKEGDLVIFLHNYTSKLPEHGPGLGFQLPEIKDSQADVNYYLWILLTWNPAVQNLAKTATAFKTHIGYKSGSGEATIPALPSFADAPPARPVGILERVEEMLGRIQAAPGYNDEVIGRDFMLLPHPAAATSSSEPFPGVSMALTQGKLHKNVEIMYTKRGHQGVCIESNTNSGPWELLAIDTAKPFVDDRPLQVANVPEIRSYRLRFWDKGVANGEWSPVQSIAVTP